MTRTGLRSTWLDPAAAGVPTRWQLERVTHAERGEPALWLAVAEGLDGAGEVLLGVGLDGPGSIEAHAQRHGARLESRPAASGDSAASVASVAGGQLREYLSGARAEFELRLLALGSAFEREAWAALIQIPHGETRSYAAQARLLGRPGAARAVGRANGRNPIPIVVPCHRVIGSDGSLTGFAGGLGLKRWLLAHEGVRLPSEAGPRLVPRNQLALF